MKGTAISKRYARAIFGLAEEASRARETLEELTALVKLCADHPELGDALYRPIHPVRERLAVWRALATRMGASPIVKNFCSYLIDKARMGYLPQICEEMALLVDERAGISRGELVAATPLREEELERLRAALSARVGRQLNLSVRVEPELIGGVVAKVGDLVFDGSLRKQLEQLRNNLTKGS